MQEAIGWSITLAIAYVAWRAYRHLKRTYRANQQARAEAFSNAVSEAVASGVAEAVSSAVAAASASGNSVSLHVGNNVARILADDHDAVRMHGDEYEYDANRAGNRGVQRSARRGELASGRTVRGRIADSTPRSSIRVSANERNGTCVDE